MAATGPSTGSGTGREIPGQARNEGREAWNEEEIPGQAGNDDKEIPGQARNEEKRFRVKPGMTTTGPSAGSGTGR